MKSSLNAVKHGLSRPIDPLVSGPIVSVVSEFLRYDDLDGSQAHELVIKILDYERNVAHQLKIFQGRTPLVISDNLVRIFSIAKPKLP